MKKALILAPLFLILALASCKKIDQLLTFYLDDSQNVTIPANFPLGTLVPITPLTVTTRSAETFKNNNTSADKVKDVSLNKLSLTITDPNGQNFDFLQKIELYIGTDQNDQVRLAYLDEVPRGVSTIELTSTNAQLDKYLKAASYTLTTKAQIRQSISYDVTVRSDSRFKVTADPL
jgi:predicted transposase YdaD